MSLDAKLAVVLSSVAVGDIGVMMDLKVKGANQKGQRVRGRQQLRLVYEHFQTPEAYGVLYSLRDLSQLRLRHGEGP